MHTLGAGVKTGHVGGNLFSHALSVYRNVKNSWKDHARDVRHVVIPWSGRPSALNARLGAFQSEAKLTDRVMQTQRLISPSPLIANSSLFLHN